MASRSAQSQQEKQMAGQGLAPADGDGLDSGGAYPLAASQERLAEPSDVLAPPGASALMPPGPSLLRRTGNAGTPN
jgi:hypothetical protein